MTKLEETAQKWCDENQLNWHSHIEAFIAGAKWLLEQARNNSFMLDTDEMYSGQCVYLEDIEELCEEN